MLIKSYILSCPPVSRDYLTFLPLALRIASYISEVLVNPETGHCGVSRKC